MQRFVILIELGESRIDRIGQRRIAFDKVPEHRQQHPAVTMTSLDSFKIARRGRRQLGEDIRQERDHPA